MSEASKSYKPVFPISIYLMVAFLIVGSAFCVAIIDKGFVIPFLIIATLAWMAFAISRRRREQSHG